MRVSLLLVDDMPDQRDMYLIHLAQLGMRARTAADGFAAIALIEAERPDAVVLDLSMPGLDGLETIRRLRGEDRTRDLPIIVVSGENHGRERAIEAGADSFVAKPLSAGSAGRRSVARPRRAPRKRPERLKTPT